ncbi:dynein regulatory complex protein 9 isoform X5 [Kogia breviceps]|uniref:dynein regulatory complex protein 9 isoform X5 n=1 Tax=Kogia breviceps TaxID=27615 RepID=UPI0034D33C31
MEEGHLEASNLPPKIWHSAVTVSVTGEPPTAVEENEETAKETAIEIIPEVMEPLSFLDVLRISAVLEDTTDQLSILNYIMPVQYEKRRSIGVKNDKELHSERKSLEKLSLVLKPSKISGPFIHKEEPKLPEIRQGDQFNKVQDLIFKKPTRQTIMNTETLKKIQIDRQFFSDVITETMQELQDSGTFTNLLKALGKERENKMYFYNIIAREKNGRKKIKSLQKQLLNVKRERQSEVQKLEEKLEFWMEKFDKDTEMKQNELNALKAAKASDLAHLQELAKTIREYEHIIIEDRIEKEKTREKTEQDHLELKSSIKLQAWWRGTVVRKEIGGFKMPKKDKGDGKDSKGKGKGKDKNKQRGKK